MCKRTNQQEHNISDQEVSQLASKHKDNLSVEQVPVAMLFCKSAEQHHHCKDPTNQQPDVKGWTRQLVKQLFRFNNALLQKKTTSKNEKRIINSRNYHHISAK